MTILHGDALALVSSFVPTPVEEKSLELILALLDHSETPFSRDHFTPGHITATALVFHPDRNRVLLIHHHRLQRWLLPGGHVEPDDATLAGTARREAMEETGIVVTSTDARLAGIDVHAIPAKRGEPLHLHHDLIFAFEAASAEVAPSPEAPLIEWCTHRQTSRRLSQHPFSETRTASALLMSSA
jgi:8-oxo-dGTP pyrophosphatase MutT (NUDIX family)